MPKPVQPQGGSSGLDFGDPAVLRGVLEQAPTATAVIEGAEHRSTFANAAFRALGVVQGQAIAASFPPAESGLMNEVYRTGRVQRLRAAGPDQRLWEVEASPLHVVDGTVHAVLVTARPAERQEPDLDHHLREVNHRVKNTLQLVSSLLTLQALTAKDPDMRRAFQEACNRIGTVTQAHQRIHSAERGARIDFSVYLREVGAELENNLAMNGQNRRIAVEADEAMVPVEGVIPLALIVNELVGNAVKHAYTPGAAGDVRIALHRLPEGGHRLTVADHGRGLPPGFDVARTDTLGMKVVRAFTGQLKGKFRAESNEPGARFVIELPG